MIRRASRGRSGITLTEILISIMIMGVGIVSLATLFPLGLLRLRTAARLTRSGYLTESAAADLGARNLLNKMSFLSPYYSPWYSTSPSGRYDPWIQDTSSYGADWLGPPLGATRDPSQGRVGAGLPVAYDPLWRAQTGIYLYDATLGASSEARFGYGIGLIRSDPGGGSPSAHGLQRITNFNPSPAVTPPGTVADIFVSPEDLVLQENSTQRTMGTGSAPSASTIVPDLTTQIAGVPVVQTDWRYSWMFTGQQSDVSNGSVFDGDIVVFENRPFAMNGLYTQGEPVVEAVFGYSSIVTATTGNYGYGAAAKRMVLLRWPTTIPDPDIRLGNWIADVTYERDAATDLARSFVDPNTNGAQVFFPYQRCNWYQIVKRTNAEAAVAFSGDPAGVSYRSMAVWVGTDLEAFTLLDSTATPVSPVHVNAALISPHVVNVFPRTVYVRSGSAGSN